MTNHTTTTTDTTTTEPTRFELALVKCSGYSVAQQRAMTDAEWFAACGPYVAAADAMIG